MNAKRPHEAIRLVPPFDTKGNVTPVNGRISREPNTFSASWASIMAAAPQAAIA